MRRAATVALALVFTSLVAPGVASTSPARVAADPVHTIVVSGDGVATYPMFDSGVSRYGITTSEETAGTVVVTASTTDPEGQVLVNGRPAPAGTRTVTGLEPGDEVAVFIVDAGGTARHSYVYLPDEFPTLERTTPDPAAGDLEPGQVLLTLSQWVRPLDPDDPADVLAFFETAVDVNGVPTYVRETSRELDFKRQPDGHFSVSRATTEPGRTGEDLVVLDAEMNPVATRRTDGLVNTDGHDSILLPDGTLWQMAYEERVADGPVDSIIQRIDPDGTVGFEWSSEPYVADAMRDQDDYAHINSFDIMADGDLLVSFRHFSAVFKIATSPHDGFAVGDVVWKLGGRDSDFAFADGDTGPCAQHTAQQLANGNILMYDNGSWNDTQAWCVDQTDLAGPPVERVQTRIIEYELDENAGTASVASSYEPPGWFAIFAGSAYRQPNGNTLIGWAEETQALASEIDEAGNLLWEIRDPQTPYPFFTYRAHKAEVPDVTRPTVEIEAPAAQGQYVEGSSVPASYGCSDRGGSGLQSCTGSVGSGGLLDTSDPGTHTFAVTAADGAGGTRTLTRTYKVLRATQPDAMVGSIASTRVVGRDEYGSSAAQRLRIPLFRPGQATVVRVRLQNDGSLPTRLRYHVKGASRAFQVRGRSVAGGRTPLLRPGEKWSFRIRIVRRPVALPGDRVLLRVPTSSTRRPVRRDAVSVLVTAARR